tara:strand:+ start:1673 stop:2338 length:666 start_codon:yes stop_codon:yes gene_type:complete
MNSLSVSKLSGICYIVGGLLAFIPFLLQILLGGPPVEGVHIFTDFAQKVVEGGKLSLFYSISSVFGFALLTYSMFNLNNLLQKKQVHALLGLGAFLFVITQLGLMIGWTIDLSIIFGEKTANIGNLFMIEMSMYFNFGSLAFIALGIISFALSDLNYLNSIFLNVVGTAFVVIGLIFIYTLFTFDDHSSKTILMMFAGVSIGQIISMVLYALLGMKLIKEG